MDNFISIETNPSLVRDMSNNGIINTNEDHYKRFAHSKKQKEEDDVKIQNIEDDIKCLKDDLCVIKKLLLNFNNFNNSNR
jgi:hypothetical protein